MNILTKWITCVRIKITYACNPFFETGGVEVKNIPQISEAELEVMKIVWELGEATSSEIVGRLTEKTEWKPKTIQTLITRLVTKEAITSEKINQKAFKYIPTIEEGEYKAEANTTFLEKMYDGSLKMLLTSFIQQNKLSKEDIQDLKNLLEEDEVK